MSPSTRTIAVIAVSVAALLLAGTATAETTYTDPAGDSGTAPDVTQVVVSDGVGLIAFRVTVPLVPSTNIVLLLNTDRNALTGKDGDEFVLAMGINADGTKWWDLDRWNGSAWEDVKSTNVRGSSSATSLEVTLSQSELGISGGFAFVVGSERWLADELEAFDSAPDGTLPWEYLLTKPTPVTPPAVLVIGAPASNAPRPRPGRRVVVRFPLSGAPTAGATVSSVVTIGGKRTASVATLAGGAARVALVVPSSAAGKKLVVRVVVRLGGKSTSRTVVLPVARPSA